MPNPERIKEAMERCIEQTVAETSSGLVPAVQVPEAKAACERERVAGDAQLIKKYAPRDPEPRR